MSIATEDGEFQMTKEELDKFHKAMQNEEFRKLLVEYAEEISNPENKKKYEEEITQMEKERGMDVKFINPEDGFVIKTTRQSDGLKAFVNICQNQNVNKATCQESEREEDGKRKRGQQWSIPFSLSQPREDLDNAGKKCTVFDAVFNPETYKKGQQDSRFKELIIKTALDGIEKQLDVKLNKKNLKFPKLKFKGMKQATVIRSKSEQQPTKESDNTLGGKTFPCPYYTTEPSSNKPTKTKSKRRRKKKGKNNNLPKYYRENSSENSSGNNNCSDSENSTNESSSSNAKQPNEPAYRIVHRGIIDFQNFTNARDSYSSTRPKELVVSIDLPLLKSTGTVELDIFERQLLLNNKEPSYHLDLTLPYPIDESNGHAKFDKNKKELVVTLPVLPPITPPHPHLGITENECEAINEVQDESTKIENGNSTSIVTIGIASQEELNGVLQQSELCQEEEKDVCESALTTLSSSSNEAHLDKGPSKGGPHNDGDHHHHRHHQDKNGLPTEALHSWKDGFVNADDVIGNTDNDWDKGDLNLLSSTQEQADLRFDVPPNLSEMSPPFFFKAPPFSFHQDVDTITFVIHVPNVTMENVSLGFNENKCYINFPSENTKPHLPPTQDYALYITFNEGQNLCPDLCRIDVNTDNMVLTLIKDDACKELWDNFKVGPGEELLEEKFFITNKNVEIMMQKIADQDPWTNHSTFKEDLKIISASKEHLTIEVENKLAESGSENVVNSENHVESKEKQSNKNEATSASEELAMDSRLFKNFEISEGILSNKIRHLKMSSPEEGIDCDFFKHERLEKYSMGMSERIAASTDPKLVQEHGHKTNLDEKRKNRSDSGESTSSDRSDVDLTIANAASRRKSCMRRSSSTSTDDSIGDDFDFNGSLSPNGTGWGSPGKKNVRFNLNPNVRVFSNKKDKQRWKMEQRLKNQKMVAVNGDDTSNSIERLNAEPIAEESHPVGDIVDNSNTFKAADDSEKKEHEDKNSNNETSLDEGWTIVERPPAEPTLENSLIFELDE